ncbi:MAG: hemagglutinin repeat-containing protein, partial [Fusobacteriaceae bacterium]|nr:hemagglutinin repeat-containing protein [Fusobacteriaceae bacterium]
MFKFFKNSKLRSFFTIIILFNLIFQNLIFAATIEVGSGTTTLDTAANGVQVVNIANPNQNGVSHNDFEKYNVGQQGVIINNSTEMGTSKLGGLVDKNSNLDRSANTIIAEVSGSEKSNIEGYTEIFGKSADFILANPNGIFVNGAGFINSSKVTLTTGKINLKENGDLIFNVKNGKIMVGEIGIDVEETDYFDIISRTASITGDIYGKNEVNIITGTNDYNYNTGEYKSNESELEKPEISIDTSALAGIYAGKIKFISTEKGVGINSNSDIVADASDVIIDVNGNIVLKNTYAKNEVKIENTGNTELKNIQSENNIKVVSAENLKTDGIISKNIDIDSKNLENNGTISAKEEVALNVKEKIANNSNIQSETLIIKSEELTNKGVINASDTLELTANKLNNQDRIQSLNQLDINSKSIENKGIIVGQNITNINTDTLNNNGIITSEKLLNLKSLLSVDNTGEISSNENLVVTTPKLDNSGKIVGIETYEIDSKDFKLSGILGGGIGNLNVDNLYISSSGEIITDSGKIIAKVVKIEGTVFSEKDLVISSNEFDNLGDIQVNSNLKISSIQINNEKNIKATENIDIQGKEITNSGQLISQNNLKIEGVENSNLKNQGTIASFNSLEILKVNTVENNTLGILYSKKDLLIDNNQKIINLGKINGVENVDIASKTLENSGDILGGNSVSIISDELNNTGKIVSSEEVNLNIVNYITNTGEIKGKNIELKSNILDNSGYILASTLNLEVYNLTNQLNSYIQGEEALNFTGYSFINNGNISSLNSIVLSSNSFLNNKDIQSNGAIVINSSNEINNNGLISSIKDIDLSATNLIKNSGTINSNDLKADAKTIDNTGKILIANNANIEAGKLNNSNQIAVTNNLYIKGNVNNSGDIFQLAENGNIIFEQGIVENNKNILAKGDINSLGATSLSNKGNIISETGDISIKNLNNEKGVIQAENNVNIKNDSTLNNKDGVIVSLSETGTIDISAKGLNNTNGKILGNNEVKVDIDGDFITSGDIQGIEKTYLEGNTLKIATNLNSNNIELKSYFDTIIESQIYGISSVIINSEGNITNNNKISSFNNIELTSSKNILNKGSILSNNLLSIIGGNITNNSLIFGKNQIVLKSDGKIYNSETILSSEGNIFIEGNKNNRASEFENYTGTLEAGEGISIKSNEVKNIGVVEGTPTLYFVKVEFPKIEFDTIFEGEIGRYKADNSTFTIDEATIKGNNIYIEGNSLNNYGSFIGGSNTINISMDGSVNNQTAIYSKYINEYILKGYAMILKPAVVGPENLNIDIKPHYMKTWYEGGTITVEAKEKAQIIAGNNLTIKGAYVGNGVQQRTNFSNTPNNQKIEITDKGLEKVKSTGTINVISNIELPKGGYGLFKVNDEFTNKEVEGIKVVKPNIELKSDSNLVDVKSTEVESKEKEKPNYHYLVETNIDFLDLSRYYGSDYFFNKIGFNPGKDMNINLLGDSYYETQLVNEAIQKTIGKQYLYDDVYSDSDQMKILYDNAQTVMSDLKLTVGVELTKEQINNLNKDIIWLVEKEVNGNRVLVPQLYLCQGTLENLTVEGSILKAGNNLSIVANTVNNTGSITANNVYVKADDISNISADSVKSQIAGNTVTLIAKNDILNSGANIIGNESVDIFSEGNVIFNTLETVTNTNLSGYEKKTVTNTLSNIVGGDITISSGKNLLLKGTNIDSTGDISLNAEEDVSIVAAKDSEYTKTVKKSKKLLSSKKTTTETYDETVINSNVVAEGNITINAGKDINVIGSNIQNNIEDETSQITLNAGEDVTIAEARELHLSNTVVEKKGLAVSFDKDNLTLKAGIEKEKTTTSTLSDLAKQSDITGGNIESTGKNITLQGANINSNAEVAFNAEEYVNILEAKDISKSETKTEKTFVGLTVSANSDILNIGDNFKQLTNLDALKGNMSSILNGGFGAIDGLRGVADGINAVPDVSANGQSAKKQVTTNANGEKKTENDANSAKMGLDKQAVKDLASVSFGITHTTEKSGEVSESSVGTNINAGNIKISSKKDTTLQGSSLNATNDIEIEAENLNILASKDKTTTYSDSQTESLSIGMGIDKDNKPNLGGVTGSFSKSESDSEQLVNNNSSINAGGNFKVTTTNDMTIKGGVVKADTVDLNVGNNLTVES